VGQKAELFNVHFECSRVFIPGLVLGAVLLFLGLLLNAQAENGINGTVTDSTGGVMKSPR
jgi:hypothetical protein